MVYCIVYGIDAYHNRLSINDRVFTRSDGKTSIRFNGCIL